MEAVNYFAHRELLELDTKTVLLLRTHCVITGNNKKKQNINVNQAIFAQAYVVYARAKVRASAAPAGSPRAQHDGGYAPTAGGTGCRRCVGAVTPPRCRARRRRQRPRGHHKRPQSASGRGRRQHTVP